MTFPNDENGVVLKRMTEQGFDFTTPHDVEFFAVFREEQMANKVARQFVADREKGEAIGEIETYPAVKGGMELRVAKKMLVTHAGISDLAERFVYRIAQHEGHLEGWSVLQEQN